ncbi:Arm DNA-binding domain-containing protein [Undibacterium flavidum]|uniref:DUF4102 domain-containing protein n=1 Tax=Undibacterium flavidum TaxID=2762297 RepID=A0ABR6YED7_9BURK|nr:Arm DNA-binding domain-containing protein [Undibacterium flavidum]MBC3874879.1 DUF4102 domain-containing protein [Undibacterium flavidum]
MKKEQINDEAKFLEIVDSGKPKTSLGNGLYFLKTKLNDQFFEFRKTIEGQEITKLIGKYPSMPLREARVEADKLLAEVGASKTEKDDREFSAKIKKIYSSIKAINPRKEKEKIPCFRDIDDANEFINALNSKVPFKVIRDERTPSLPNGIETEIYAAIWLLLLTPLSIEDFISANWDNVRPSRFNNTATCLWTLSSQDNKIRYLTLPNKASIAVEYLNDNFSGRFTGKVFPHLSTCTEKEINTKLIATIKEIWPQYKIDPTQFRHFFIHIASEYSAFKPEFIKSYALTNNFHNLCHVSQHALADWWDYQLINNNCAFESVYGTLGRL